MEKIKAEQSFSKEKRPIEEKLEKIEIPEKDWQILKIIAQRIGGDFRMEVKLGESGGGSFLNSEDNSITFDPLHIRDNIEQAKFVAGHEGSHRAITIYPKKLGLSQEEIRELYSQTGFGYLQNAIEDPAVNDWMRKRFPGLESYTAKTYNEQLKEENAVLSSLEVQKIATQLGYWPKFSQYGSEVIRDWHQKRFSEKLDPAVKKALQRTIDYARQSISNIPDPQKPSRDKKEIITAGQKRFENNTNYIWPEVKKLVEMDLHTEEQRQMLNDFRQKQKELEQKRKEIEQAQKQGDKGKQEELQKEIDGLKKELDPFNELPEDTQKELQEQINKAIREVIEQLNKEIEEKQKQVEQAKQKQEELEKQIQEKKTEKLSQETKQKQEEKDLKDVQDALDNIQSCQEMPYPEDKLSEKTKQELKKLFNKLPRQKQEKLKDKAKKQLEDFENAINKDLEGKLNKDKPESQKERREREVKEREVEREKEKAKKERKEMGKKLEELRQEKMTEYDKVYKEVADIIDPLYVHLKRLFLSERHPKWQKGYPTGLKLDLGKAMQVETDPRYLEKIWERKTIPHKFDYRFSILVDSSYSMEGEKIKETFKGVAVLAETLEKLGIQYEILGFSNESKIFKGWKEKLNRESREKLTKMKSWGRKGTATAEATQKAYQELLKNLGKDNFLITLTDGQPDNSEGLKQELATIIKEKKVKLVGIGLGPNTEFVKDFYKAAFSLNKMKVSDEERRQGQKDFAEAFADLLEDMIKYPEKY